MKQVNKLMLACSYGNECFNSCSALKSTEALQNLIAKFSKAEEVAFRLQLFSWDPPLVNAKVPKHRKSCTTEFYIAPASGNHAQIGASLLKPKHLNP